MAVLSFQKAEMHYHCDMRCTEKVSLQKNHHHLMIHNHRYQCHHRHHHRRPHRCRCHRRHHHHPHCDMRRTEKGFRQKAKWIPSYSLFENWNSFGNVMTKLFAKDEDVAAGVVTLMVMVMMTMNMFVNKR